MKTTTWLIVFVIGFSIMWLAPLMLPVATLYRYALEEMRVLAVGILLGYFIAWGSKAEAKPRQSPLIHIPEEPF